MVRVEPREAGVTLGPNLDQSRILNQTIPEVKQGHMTTPREILTPIEKQSDKAYFSLAV